MVYSGTVFPKSIDHSFRGNYMAFIDTSLKKMTIAPINVGNPSYIMQVLTIRELKHPSSVSIDWIHDLIYWTDINTINVLHINRPNDYYTIIITVKTPQVLIANPMDSCLIWTEIGPKPQIWRSLQDGSQQTVLYSTDKQPFHLINDIHLKRYFFINTGGYLNSINYQGGDEKAHFQSESLHNINSAVIYGDNIFLSIDSSLFSINKFGHNSGEVLFAPKVSSSNNLMVRYLLDFKLIDSILQLDIENKCRFAKCSHLCLPSNQSFRCLCPEKHFLLKDSICVENSIINVVENSVMKNQSLFPPTPHSILTRSLLKK